MAERPRSRAWATRGPLLCVAAVAALATTTPAAGAHTELLDSRPAAGEVAEDAVDRIRLEFATPVLDEFTDVVVTGGSPAPVADLRVSGAVVEADVEGLDATGRYVVSYRTVAVDGHPVAGSFAFEVGPDAARAAVGRRNVDGHTAADTPRGTSLLAVTVVGATVAAFAGVSASRRRRSSGFKA